MVRHILMSVVLWPLFAVYASDYHVLKPYKSTIDAFFLHNPLLWHALDANDQKTIYSRPTTEWEKGCLKDNGATNVIQQFPSTTSCALRYGAKIVVARIYDTPSLMRRLIDQHGMTPEQAENKIGRITAHAHNFPSMQSKILRELTNEMIQITNADTTYNIVDITDNIDNPTLISSNNRGFFVPRPKHSRPDNIITYVYHVPATIKTEFQYLVGWKDGSISMWTEYENFTIDHGSDETDYGPVRFIQPLTEEHPYILWLVCSTKQIQVALLEDKIKIAAKIYNPFMVMPSSIITRAGFHKNCIILEGTDKKTNKKNYRTLDLYSPSDAQKIDRCDFADAQASLMARLIAMYNAGLKPVISETEELIFKELSPQLQLFLRSQKPQL